MSQSDLEKPEQIDFVDAVEGELLSTSTEEETLVSSKEKIALSTGDDQKPNPGNSKYYLQYILVPFVFLTITLLGGLRIGIKDGEFIFLKPPLICLIFAVLLLVLFFRAKLIRLDGWFSESFSTLRNAANGAVLLTLFSASAQVFNSLIPERGLPFWVISFCFLWTLWNNLFADFDTKRLLQSLGGLFGFAFVAKYLVMANLVSREQGSWLARIWENPTQEAFTYFLDLPGFSGVTGYIQFFALMFYLIGLFFLNPGSDGKNELKD